MTKNTELTAETARELLEYDGQTGVLTWRKRGVEFFHATGKYSAERSCAAWNGRYAGKPAGGLDGDGYVRVKIFDRLYQAHRIIWLIVTGSLPADQIDHRNGDRIDNLFDNLRAVTHAENGRNQGMLSTNTSGFKGVSWHKRSRKWVAHIRLQSKRKHLGQFDTPEAARAAYVTAAIESGYSDRHIFGEAS